MKSVNIHTSSRKIDGNVSQIVNQIDVALNSEFIDEGDNVKKKIDNLMLVTSGKINDHARNYLHSKYPQRALNIIDQPWPLNSVILPLAIIFHQKSVLHIQPVLVQISSTSIMNKIESLCIQSHKRHNVIWEILLKPFPVSH